MQKCSSLINNNGVIHLKYDGYNEYRKENYRDERSKQLVGGCNLRIPQGAKVETINL